jgi:hypothetical protein
VNIDEDFDAVVNASRMYVVFLNFEDVPRVVESRVAAPG